MKLKSLKLILAAAVLSFSTAPAFSAGSSVPLQDAQVNLDNKLSLARGAKFYANYCMGCHSLKFSRYNRVAADIGLEEEDIKSIIFTRNEDNEINKTGALMENTIPTKDAARWFGTAPPDLSLIARSRGGGDWIYSYMKSFYRDDSRPFGVNNTVFENVGMPHVLLELQGMQELEVHDDGKGHVTKTLKLVEPGKMSVAEYDQVARDLTNFLVYVAEPAQLHRTFYGVLTLLFLFVLFIFSYLLKKEFWKDIH
ncbi:cytochrome c1 [Leucothrix pacifica]|uniref:Cytochrome c1 n=1 Tax=Leucothrix pacifica TaxID=1247513 RepID=A0A317CLT7_9GAMM|nr:cytochrome c1 [Leucothrix pacifica]PWQ99177.1 cytochrome c1 [Leucothrix pacifica]